MYLNTVSCWVMHYFNWCCFSSLNTTLSHLTSLLIWITHDNRLYRMCCGNSISYMDETTLVNSTASLANRQLTVRYWDNRAEIQAESDALVSVGLTTCRCAEVLFLYKAISLLLAVSWFAPGPQTHSREPPFSYFSKRASHWMVGSYKEIVPPTRSDITSFPRTDRMTHRSYNFYRWYIYI